jgi:long-chain acyl-CoA synthetase
MKRSEIPFKDFERVIDPFLNTVKAYPDNLFLRVRRKGRMLTFTYRAASEQVRRVAHSLKENGFMPGERAAIVGENGPEWIFSYLGILWAGGVVVPLDPRARPAEWAHLMRHSDCKFIFCSFQAHEDIKQTRDAMPRGKKIILFPWEDSQLNLFPPNETDKALSGPEPRLRDDMAVILYTSGTTGDSKGVVLTHGNLLANLGQVLAALEIHEKDRFLSVLPLHHCFESTCGFLLPLAEGASITFPGALKSNELLADLKEVRPTVFLVVPLLLEKLHRGLMKTLKKGSPTRRGLFYGLKTLSEISDRLLKGRASKTLLRRVRGAMGLDELRYLVSGGAALPRELSREYERLGFPILQGYGLTETAPVVSVNLPKKCRNESTGLPLPGIEVKIVNPSPEGIGEIVIKGPNVMRGYYRNEQATQETLQGGWLYTGDLGKIDEAGFLHVTGRKKSLIVTRGGKNINPEEIEEEFLRSPLIKECLVLARIHPRTQNEEIHAIIHPDSDHLDEVLSVKGLSLSEELLRSLIQQEVERANSTLAKYKRITSFSIRQEEFPKTTTQKIKRYLFEKGGIEV